MPANIIPTTYLAGVKAPTSDGSGALAGASLANSTQDLCIPLATLTGAVAGDIDPTTGDIRKIIFALETALYAAYQAVTVADRPARWTCNRSSNINDASGIVTRVFVNQFSTETTGEEVAAE